MRKTSSACIKATISPQKTVKVSNLCSDVNNCFMLKTLTPGGLVRLKHLLHFSSSKSN